MSVIEPNSIFGLMLIITRVIGVFFGFPLLNTSMIPTNVKLFLVVTVSFFILKYIHPSVEISSFLTIFLLVLKELFLGFSIGILVNIFTSAFSYAAEIMSYFMGLTVVNIFDPTFGQISVINKFFIMLFYVIFFLTDSYIYVFGSLVSSFDYFPLTSVGLSVNMFEFVIRKSQYLFIVAFQIAFPFALILYLLNVALALVNRLIPQINVFIVGLPMQIFVGVLALAFGSSVLVYIAISLLQRVGEDFIDFLNFLPKSM